VIMNRSFILLIASLFVFASCSNQVQEKEEVVEDIMYEPSELAQIMHSSEAMLEIFKSKIEKGEVPFSPDRSYKKILTAQSTEEGMKDSLFYANATPFINAMDSVNNIIDMSNSKVVFNAAVQACLNCHANSCGGPIPRIRKLFIE
jgi:hypothetical protein